MTDNDKKPVEKKSLSQASYLVSILVAFLGPILFLIRPVWRGAAKKPLFMATGVIAVLGWIWSTIVSSNRWWVFGEDFILGFEIWPNLPLEEFLFYPLGGFLCIVFYLTGTKRKTVINAAAYWAFLIVGTVAFSAITWARFENGPYYLLSQLILYNLLCCLLLAPLVARQMNLIGLAIPIAVLSVVGFLWDYVAFSKGWWNYLAVTKIYISIVPLDDFNFFLYAPTAAASIYLLFCRLQNVPPWTD